MSELQEAFSRKAKEFDSVIKMGRTHLQDAVPIRLGQEFLAYARVLSRDTGRVRRIEIDSFEGKTKIASSNLTGLL